MVSTASTRSPKLCIPAVLGVLGIGMFLGTQSAQACSCAAFPADETKAAKIALDRADVVFLGVVTDVRSKLVMLPPSRDATFDVYISWKGLSGHDQTVVRTAVDEAACGFKFQKRSWYLVFGNWDRKKKILRTNMCELTREESKAQGLIKALDALTQRE